MVDIDPDTAEILTTTAIIPLSLISILFIGFQSFISSFYYYFFGAAIAVSLIISVFTVWKIMHRNYLLLIPGILLFTLAFSVFLISILNVLAGEFKDISLVVFIIIITAFLLLFPLFEWFTLTGKRKKDAVLPLQHKVETILEKITKGKRVYSLLLYVLIFATIIPIFYVVTKNFVITLILAAFIIPLINLGYITGLNVGDELLWFKHYRKQVKDPKQKLKLQLIGVNWEKRTLGLYKVSLGHTLASLLGVVLVGMSFYGVYRNISIIFVSSTSLIGVYITLSKSLVLSGRNAVSQTKRIWRATVLKDEPNNFDLFYPIYIGVTILSIIALQVIAKFSNEVTILSGYLGILDNRGLVFIFLLIETLVFLVAVIVVLVKQKDPIQIREFEEKDFEKLSPVEKLFAIEKLYKNVLTHPTSKLQVKALARAISVGTNKINSTEIFPFLTSPEIKLRRVSTAELRRLLETDETIAEDYLILLRKGKLDAEIQRLLVRELTYLGYVPELRKLAIRNKISANWIVRSLRGQYLGSSAIVSDEKYLYVASQSKILVWTKDDHQFITTLEEKQGPIKALFCDEIYLYSGGCNDVIIVWDKKKFEKVLTLKGHKGDVYSVFSDDEFIYTGAEDSQLHIWKKEDLSLAKTLKIDKGCINCIRGTEKYLFAAVDDSNIYVWDKSNFELVNVLSEHTGKVWTLYLDKNYLYSGSQDNSIIVWDLKKLKPVNYIEDIHRSSIYALCGDDDYIYSSSHDRTVSVINKEDFSLFTKVDNYSSASRAIHVDKGNLYTTTYDKLVLIWDKDTISLIKPIKIHDSRINAIHNDTRYLYSASDDKTIKVWNKSRKELKLVSSLEDHKGAVVGLVGDTSYLYSVSTDKTLKKWNKLTFKNVRSITAHKKRIHCIRLVDTKIYTCSADETIAIWDKSTLEKLDEIKIEGVAIKSIDVDKQYIYAGGSDQILYIYDSTTLEQVCYLQQEESDIKSILSSKDFIYIGHDNGKILKWDKEDFSFEKQIGYHYEAVTSIVEDKKYLYTSSTDNSIKIWLKETGTYLTSIYQHASWVNCLTVGRKHVYSGSSDKSIKRIKKFPVKSVIRALLPYIIILAVLITVSLVLFFRFR